MVELEVRELLTDFGFDGDGSPMIRGSALQALEGKDTEFGVKSIRELLDSIDNYIPDPQRDLTSPFMLPIDNAFLVPGRGTVVIGTIARGTLKKGEDAELLGFDAQIKTVVNDIQVFKKSQPEAKAGENVGVLLRGVKLKTVERGMLLCALNSEKVSNRFKASVYFLTRSEGGRSKPIISKYIQQLFSKTWNIACRVDLGTFFIKFLTIFRFKLRFSDENVNMIMPGEHGAVTLTLLNSMVMINGQAFTIRENNVTVATGIITETLPAVHIMTTLSKLNV